MPSRTVRRGVRLTPAVSGWTPPPGWTSPHSEAGLRHVRAHGGRFSISCDERIKAVARSTAARDYLNQGVIRQDNQLGFVSLQDLIDAMWTEDHLFATVA